MVQNTIVNLCAAAFAARTRCPILLRVCARSEEAARRHLESCRSCSRKLRMLYYRSAAPSTRPCTRASCPPFCPPAPEPRSAC